MLKVPSLNPPHPHPEKYGGNRRELVRTPLPICPYYNRYYIGIFVRGFSITLLILSNFAQYIRILGFEDYYVFIILPVEKLSYDPLTTK